MSDDRYRCYASGVNGSGFRLKGSQVRCQMPDVLCHFSGIRYHRLWVRCQGSGVRPQRAAGRCQGQRSGIRGHTYSLIEDHRRPVVFALLQHKDDVAWLDGQLIAGFWDEFKQHRVRFSLQSPASTGHPPPPHTHIHR